MIRFVWRSVLLMLAAAMYTATAQEMMLAAMAGATRHVLEAGASPAMIRGLRQQLVLLCQSYMAAQPSLRAG